MAREAYPIVIPAKASSLVIPAKAGIHLDPGSQSENGFRLSPE
jgi:hypothetical protein